MAVSNPVHQTVASNCFESKLRRRFGLAALSTGFFLVVLDVSVVNVALKAIRETYAGDLSTLQWVIDSYSLSFASLQLSGGSVADRFGGKRIFLAGLLGFLVSSAFCAVAPTLNFLLLGRALQGISGAILAPASMCLLRHCYSDSKERAHAIAFWFSAGGSALAAGPVVGGLFISSFGWRSIFLINVPICLLACVLTMKYVAESPKPQAVTRINIVSQALCILALSAITFVLIDGARLGWASPLISGCLCLALGSMLALAIRERKSSVPILPSFLLSSKTFAGATLVGLLLNFTYYGSIFVLSIYFLSVRGFSPFAAGLAFLPLTASTFVSNWLSGRVVARQGPRASMLAGLTVTGLALIGLSAMICTFNYLFVLPLLALVGLGAGLTAPAMVGASLVDIPPARAGVAAGVLNSGRQTGAVIGVAALGTVVQIDQVHQGHMNIGLALALASLAQALALIATWCLIKRSKHA